MWLWYSKALNSPKRTALRELGIAAGGPRHGSQIIAASCQKLIPARIVSEIGGLGVRHTIAVCVNWPNIVVFFFRRAWSSLFKDQVRTSNAIGFVTGFADGLSDVLKAQARKDGRLGVVRRLDSCPFARSCRAQPGKVRSQEARRVYRLRKNNRDAVRQ